MALILTDVDGTLVDNVFLHYLTHREIWWRKLGYPDPLTLPSFPEFVEKIHGGTNFSSQPIYEELGVKISPEEKYELFKRIFYEKHFSNVHLFQGVQEVLWWLREKGHTLGIVSGAPFEVIWKYLEQFDILYRENGRVLFKYIFPDTNDKAPAITFIRERENVTPSQCLFVGDTPRDIRAAHISGVRPIAHLSRTNECILKHIETQHLYRLTTSWYAIPYIVSHLPA